MSKTKHKDKLQQLLNFTDEDLEANEKGELTDAQIQNLKIQAFINASVPILALGLMPLLPSAWILSLQPELNIVCVLVPANLILVLYLVYKTLMIWRVYNEDLEAGISKIKGTIWLEARQWRVYPFIRIEDKRFQVSDRLYSLLEKLSLEHMQWIVYYMPKSLTILSVEKLANE